MNRLPFDELFSSEIPPQPQRSARSKPVKRKWREIEAVQDRQRLMKELMDLDVCYECSQEDIDL